MLALSLAEGEIISSNKIPSPVSRSVLSPSSFRRYDIVIK